MAFHHHFFQLIKNRYFGLRLFLSSLSVKILIHAKPATTVYLSRLVGELSLLLPISLFIILLFNLLQPRSQFEISKNNLLENSGNGFFHQFLAHQLIATNQFDEAEKEARLANSQELLQQIQEIKNRPEEIKREVLKLQRVIEKFPNYRDGYIKLAILNWKLYRPFDAQKYLDKTLEVDPNNQFAKQLILILAPK